MFSRRSSFDGVAAIAEPKDYRHPRWWVGTGAIASQFAKPRWRVLERGSTQGRLMNSRSGTSARATFSASCERFVMVGILDAIAWGRDRDAHDSMFYNNIIR